MAYGSPKPYLQRRVGESVVASSVDIYEVRNRQPAAISSSHGMMVTHLHSEIGTTATWIIPAETPPLLRFALSLLLHAASRAI